MPVSYVINTQLPKLKIAYGIVILTSILTTAISLIAGLMQNVKKKITKNNLIFNMYKFNIFRILSKYSFCICFGYKFFVSLLA